MSYILYPLNYISDTIPYDGNDKEIGNVIDNRLKNHLDGVYNVVENLKGQLFSLWEYREKNRDGKYEEKQEDGITKEIADND